MANQTILINLGCQLGTSICKIHFWERHPFPSVVYMLFLMYSLISYGHECKVRERTECYILRYPVDLD
jgi:hypothetical protein